MLSNYCRHSHHVLVRRVVHVDGAAGLVAADLQRRALEFFVPLDRCGRGARDGRAARHGVCAVQPGQCRGLDAIFGLSVRKQLGLTHGGEGGEVRLEGLADVVGLLGQRGVEREAPRPHTA